MQLHKCLARSSASPAGSEGAQTSALPCSGKVEPPKPFCEAHYAEYVALRTRKAIAARDAATLQGLVDNIKGSEDLGGTYSPVREVRKDATVIQVYLESLEVAVGADQELKERFLAGKAEGDPGEDKSLEEQKEVAEALLRSLEQKETRLLREEQTKTTPLEASGKPKMKTVDGKHDPPHTISDAHVEALTNPSAFRCNDPKLRKERESRLCFVHRITAISSKVGCVTDDITMEAARAAVVRHMAECRTLPEKVFSLNTELGHTVRRYYKCVNDMMKSAMKHQNACACCSASEYTAYLNDLREKRDAASHLLLQTLSPSILQKALPEGTVKEHAHLLVKHLDKMDARKSGWAFGCSLAFAAAASVAGAPVAGALGAAALGGWAVRRLL
ncbi:uncharacterized protein BXZ73DRAFT_105599 [Epithele typhae]|uniref:uncharacterized protein n=1 Tax=Epithele typhae TaxID=378194 RepID=UPI0020078972|nr:uncharacterized protein BXZ73DRAFT_105599 [Epithele typhae]KAH9917125.1 hypothetical protein BXZ73DRAFT_105599 [Epithele typhae]